MVRKLIHDPILLAQKSEPATPEDLDTVQDLLDTLEAHRESCIGMAANMIGVYKNIIAFNNEGTYMVMLNPVIIKAKDEYNSLEGCLSLLGGLRKAKRFDKIKVQYQTTNFQTKIKNFRGIPAQVIQHEIDHCNGILI